MTFVIAIFMAPLIVLTLCFAVEVFVGVKPLLQLTLAADDRRSAVIIVPAHDEQSIIQSTIENLKSAASGRTSILVVADNCSDKTAQIARDVGAQVIERSDPSRRGKGFALDFARRHLSAKPPEIVLIVDADCAIDAPSIDRLIRCCADLGVPCQATNLQRPAEDASPAVQLSTFAFFIKNVIRQRALQRLAGRVHLLGTGMAFPWRIFASAELATGNIVEDLKLGQELASAGHAPVFIEEAEVWSRAETDANTISQRRRWEGGFLQNAVRIGPRLFARALLSANPRLLWAAIDLMIPPFALLILLDLVFLLAAAALKWLGFSQLWPLYSMCGALLVAMIALALAWIRGGSQFVSLQSLLRAPLYVAWKLPMYVGLARRGAPRQWLRTER